MRLKLSWLSKDVPNLACSDKQGERIIKPLPFCKHSERNVIKNKFAQDLFFRSASTTKNTNKSLSESKCFTD